MGVNYGDEKYASKYVFLPKVGEEAIFDIKEIHEVKCDKPKMNFSRKEVIVLPDQSKAEKTVDLGYHVEAVLKNGKFLVITNFAAFINVFKKHEIQDGEKVKIVHPDKGVWKVEKI